MTNHTPKQDALNLGDRVYAGHGEDYDEGAVLALDGDQVDVGWDSGVRSTQAASLLTVL